VGHETASTVNIDRQSGAVRNAGYPVDIPQDQVFELSDSMVVRTANAAWATQAN